MTIDRRSLLALIARGARIRATRVMPFPHRYTLDVGGGEPRDVGEEATRELVDQRLLVGKPQDGQWDTVLFDPTEALTLAALAYFAHGFGGCPVCDQYPLGAGRKRNTPRHGTADGNTPCAGAGLPLIDVIAPDANAPISTQAVEPPEQFEVLRDVA